ncbi:substrate-binding periplasmic protein [Terasakiella pusilla]|uniref:substrate-binding periplasmic protein n=1 Tax=Terasakiella pusilla TaxID=64973 RepID=UPI000491E2FD|nr:transporter substrate-binding domain-containing protein [Terasakiella pusilla]
MRALFFLVTFIFTISPLQAADKIKVVTTEIPPYTIEIGMRPGIMIELIKLIEDRIGHKHDITFYPWARAQMLVQSNPNHIIFPLARNSEREDKYDWALKVMQVDAVFVTLNGQKVSLKDAKNLNHITVQQSSPFETLLKEKGFTNVIASARTPDQHLRLLEKGRVDAWYTSKDHAQYTMADTPFASKALFSDPVKSEDVYMAFSKKFPPSLRQKYIDIFNELKEDGMIDHIRKQYR